MKEKKIMLPSVEEAKHFVAEATKCDFDIDVFYNRVTIDAKSILGVLSLDLARVLTVQMNGDNAEFEEYLDTLAPVSTTEVPDWDSYDTAFIGYPIWWGIAAWPVDTFVKNNDFTGKTVIPFATSSSSGMGQSGSLLADMAGTGEWQEGQRFSSGVSSDDVQSWVNGLGL